MDKDLLFKARIAEEELEIPGVGIVRIRGLNHAESHAVSKMDDLTQRTLHMIALGMVDPQLSVSEVKRWGEAAPGGELESVAAAIAEMSGMTADSAKRAYKSVRSEPGP